MKAELYRENIHTSCPSKPLTIEILTEGDAIVPDSKPDILKVLCVQGHCHIDKTEAQKDRVLFTGTAEFTVLYCPEEGEAVNTLSVSVPFNHIEEGAGVMPEDHFFSDCRLVHTECSLINSRKISLKGILSLSFLSFSDAAIAVTSDIKAPDIEIKKEKMQSTSLVGSKNDSFTMAETLEVPDAQSSVKELLLCRAKICDTSVKLVTGKAVVKGSLSVFHLYSTEDGALQYMEHELPFTEIVDVPHLSEDMACDVFLSLGTCHSSCEEGDNQGRLVRFEAACRLCIFAFDTVTFDSVTDAYVPGMKASLDEASFKKAELIEHKVDSLTVKEAVDLPSSMPPMDRVCPVFAQVSAKDVRCENGRLHVSGQITVVILYITDDPCPLAQFTHELPFSAVYDCPKGELFASLYAEVSHCDYTFVNQGKLDIRCLVDVTADVYACTNSYNVIAGADFEEAPRAKRPSIIIYFVKSGDTLWNIAKRYNTTVEKILSANAMTSGDILNVGMRLLIPA